MNYRNILNFGSRVSFFRVYGDETQRKAFSDAVAAFPSFPQYGAQTVRGGIFPRTFRCRCHSSNALDSKRLQGAEPRLLALKRIYDRIPALGKIPGCDQCGGNEHRREN